MNENEIMRARHRHGNINRRDYMVLFRRVLDHMLERGPIVQDDDVIGSYACYWCGNHARDHETDCIWLDVQEVMGEN